MWVKDNKVIRGWSKELVELSTVDEVWRIFSEYSEKAPTGLIHAEAILLALNHRHISSSSPKLTRQKIKIRYFQIFNCCQYFSFEPNVNTLLLDVGVVENNRLKCSMSDVFCWTDPLVSRVTCHVCSVTVTGDM